MAVDTITLDALATSGTAPPSRGAKLWAATWPKLVAFGLFTAAWQIVVWSGWKPEYILPSPLTVYNGLLHNLGDMTSPAILTLQRAILGYAIAIAVGGFIGIAVARVRILRAGVGSMITGLQTMPSVAWFPLA